MNNRIRRNIWLILTVLSCAIFVDRCMRIGYGEIEWWQIIPVIIMLGFCNKFYQCYKRQVKKGNIYGRVKVFK